MKKTVISLFILAIVSIISAQVPNGFNYQAILRNADGLPILNETISLQVSISNQEGVSSYFEVHNTMTNEYGLVNVVIGDGTSSDDISSVEWEKGPYFIELAVNGETLGSSPILSVPYALYAASGNEGPTGPAGPQGEPGEKGDAGDSVWIQSGGDIIYSEGRVGIGTAEPEESLDVDGNIRATGTIYAQGQEELATKAYVDMLMQKISDQLLEDGKEGFVTDIDGNLYSVVKIGEQIWMSENLKTTRNNDGTEIPNVADAGDWTNIEGPAYCWYNNSTEMEDWGAYYNWYTVNTGNLCPSGWHVPSDLEWRQLEEFLGMDGSVAQTDGFRGANEGGMLKTTDLWDLPNTGASNEVNFSAKPSGRRDYLGDFVKLNTTAFFWTSELGPFSEPFRRLITNDSGQLSRSVALRTHGMSVRCVKDM